MSDLPKVPDLVPPTPELPTRNARPWDLFNKNIERVTDEIQKERMAICRECPFFIKLTGQCSKCGCIMESKTRLSNAFCPEAKWREVVIPEDSVSYKEEE